MKTREYNIIWGFMLGILFGMLFTGYLVSVGFNPESSGTCLANYGLMAQRLNDKCGSSFITACPDKGWCVFRENCIDGGYCKSEYKPIEECI